MSCEFFGLLDLGNFVVCDDYSFDAVVRRPVRKRGADIPRVVDGNFLPDRNKTVENGPGVQNKIRTQIFLRHVYNGSSDIRRYQLNDS